MAGGGRDDGGRASTIGMRHSHLLKRSGDPHVTPAPASGARGRARPGPGSRRPWAWTVSSGRADEPVPQSYQVGKVGHVLEPVWQDSDAVIVPVTYGHRDGVDKLGGLLGHGTGVCSGDHRFTPASARYGRSWARRTVGPGKEAPIHAGRTSPSTQSARPSAPQSDEHPCRQPMKTPWRLSSSTQPSPNSAWNGLGRSGAVPGFPPHPMCANPAPARDRRGILRPRSRQLEIQSLAAGGVGVVFLGYPLGEGDQRAFGAVRHVVAQGVEVAARGAQHRVEAQELP